MKRRCGEIRFEASQENLKLLKRDYEADVAAAEFKYSQDIEAAAAAAKELKETIPKEMKDRAEAIKKIDDDLSEYESGLLVKRDSEQRAAQTQEEQRLRERAQMIAHYEREIADAESSANAIPLSNAGALTRRRA